MTTPSTPATWSQTDLWLKASHLQGKTVTVTIRSIEFVEVHPRPGQVETKPVMYMVESTKGLILTATNVKYLRTTYGDNIAAAHGQRVNLHAEHIRVAGRELDTIRISAAPTQEVKTPK